MTVFGVHTGLQHISTDELRGAWRRIESLGYGWISIWDHFYGATGQPDDAECLEAVALHAALACETSRVRIGSLVYSIGYRHPAVLAKAITAIDNLSGGRADMGLGAGWAEVEYNAYGIPYPDTKVRMDQLEEGIQVLRGLLHDDVTTFDGQYFQLRDARNEPRPVQSKLPIWIGGGGEKRTLKIAARYADGWNVPFISPADFAHKRGVLAQHCETVGRDPSEIRCAINVALAWTEESLQAQFGKLAPLARNGCLTGSDDQVLERVGEYVAAGADQVNIALRAPFDLDAIERLSIALGLGLMAIVLHLVPATVWTALGPEDPVTNPSLATEGFIHCTDEAAVLLQVANAFYSSIAGDFVALHVDTEHLSSECIWEAPAHINGNGQAFAERFPHVYGVIDRPAVVAVQPVVRDGDLRFVGYGAVEPIG